MIQIQYIIFCCSIIRYEVFPDEKCSGMLIPDIIFIRLKKQRSSAVQKKTVGGTSLTMIFQLKVGRAIWKGGNGTGFV